MTPKKEDSIEADRVFISAFIAFYSFQSASELEESNGLFYFHVANCDDDVFSFVLFSF